MNKILISFIVCSNGYGHLKRVLSVVKNILRINDKIDIVIFCPDSHINFAKGEINFVGVGARCSFNSDVSTSELNWTSSGGVSLAKFVKWQNELSSHPVLIQSNLIVSDNHVTPVTIFENVKLMGSFIWDDVVNFRNKDVNKIKDVEFFFLDKRKPEMYCLNDFAMPAVVEKTSSVQLPWFCERFEAKDKSEEKSILVTGGGTALTNAYLFNVTLNLLELGVHDIIYLDSMLFELMSGISDKRIRKFTFTDLDFFNLKAIVCRPGIGILTDCIKYGIPPIVIDDGFNLEISHNANTINRLELGKSFNISENTILQVSNEIIRILNNGELLTRFREKIKLQKTGGAEKAAELIVTSIL